MGISALARSLNVDCTCAVVVSITVAASRTSTVVLTPATLSETFTVAVWFNRTLTFCSVDGTNPFAVAVML